MDFLKSKFQSPFPGNYELIITSLPLKCLFIFFVHEFLFFQDYIWFSLQWGVTLFHQLYTAVSWSKKKIAYVGDQQILVNVMTKILFISPNNHIDYTADVLL